jgi:hypothetical protein
MLGRHVRDSYAVINHLHSHQVDAWVMSCTGFSTGLCTADPLVGSTSLDVGGAPQMRNESVAGPVTSKVSDWKSAAE